MPIMNATSARNNFFKLIDEAINTHEPVTVTGAYSGVSGRRFRKHPDTKPALSGHLVS